MDRFDDICNSDYKDLVFSFADAIENTREVDDDYSTKHYEPSYKTPEESVRDSIISELLDAYKDRYKEKVKADRKYKTWILIISGLFLISFIVLSYILAINMLSKVKVAIHLATGFIAIASIFASIFGVINIIVKYAFPSEEERYITDIVKAIQNNDLETLKVRRAQKRLRQR